jgi:dihydrofolate reductase
MFDIIVCTDDNNGIGYYDNINNIHKLPWKIKEDMKYFKDITSKTNNPNLKNIVIMGRKTWESLPLINNERYLKNRINIVITSKNKDKFNNCSNIIFAKNFNDSLFIAKNIENYENIFIIGGKSIYEQALKSKKLRYLYLNKINKKFNTNIFFPNININNFKLLQEQHIITKQDIKLNIAKYIVFP